LQTVKPVLISVSFVGLDKWFVPLQFTATKGSIELSPKNSSGANK
jgi:hypothetical protein